MTTKQATSSTAHVGDWIDARGLYGQPPRRGEIVELLGRERHRRYRVRWDEHESILYPADGVIIIPPRRRARHAAR